MMKYLFSSLPVGRIIMSLAKVFGQGSAGASRSDEPQILVSSLDFLSDKIGIRIQVARPYGLGFLPTTIKKNGLDLRAH